jgi:CDP-diacylglycerol--serine O-phosphatidyltransferase
VFAFPQGLTGPWEAAAVLAMVIVPALLMVSTIRFRSFKTFDLHSRRSYPALLLIALGLAALAARPEEVLLVAAYAYLASAFVGMAWTRLRRRPKTD